MDPAHVITLCTGLTGFFSFLTIQMWRSSRERIATLRAQVAELERKAGPSLNTAAATPVVVLGRHPMGMNDAANREFAQAKDSRDVAFQVQDGERFVKHMSAARTGFKRAYDMDPSFFDAAYEYAHAGKRLAEIGIGNYWQPLETVEHIIGACDKSENAYWMAHNLAGSIHEKLAQLAGTERQAEHLTAMSEHLREAYSLAPDGRKLVPLSNLVIACHLCGMPEEAAYYRNKLRSLPGYDARFEAMISQEITRWQSQTQEEDQEEDEVSE